MNKKNLIIILIGIIILLLVGWQVFQYNKYGGNLIVNISNQSEIDTVKIEIFQKDKKLISDVFTNDVFHNYKEFTFKKGLGNHTLTVSADKYQVKKVVNVNTLLVTWLVIDFYENDDIPEGYTLYTAKRKKPLVIE